MTDDCGPARARGFGVRSLLTLLAVALVYVAAARFGFLLAFATKQVTAVWPPAAIGLVALLLLGSRVWPGIYLGALIANATANEPLATAAGIAVGNTLGPLAGAYLLGRVARFDPKMKTLRDVFALALLGGVVSMTVSATLGVANLALAGIVPWSAYGSVWWIWWAGDTMGVLLLAPFLLAWIAEPRIRFGRLRFYETLLLFVALTIVSGLAFGGDYEFLYVVYPFIIWAALRLGQRETATAVLMISGIAIWGAIHGRGAFASGTFDERLVRLELFMAVTALAGMVLGAVTAERRRAEASLQQAHDELETRVKERTAELATTNTELARKNEEVEAFVYIVSHDLRAPLVNLQGFSKELHTSCRELEGALGQAALPADVARVVRLILDEDIPCALRYISASTTKFQRLIDSLLVLSRSGREQYRAEPVDVREVVDTTLDSLRQSIAQSGARVSVAPLPFALGDATAIGQVFANLIGNALKYLQPGRSGVVDIGGTRNSGVVRYWVKDNGAGIPARAQRRLFQVFQRFHPELAPGDGMGLAIVKRVVERQGGQVSAESQEGVGTTFHITLPAVAKE